MNLLTVKYWECSGEDIKLILIFIVDLFLKTDYDDDFTSIDFLAELDKDEKMYFDGEL